MDDNNPAMDPPAENMDPEAAPQKMDENPPAAQEEETKPLLK